MTAGPIIPAGARTLEATALLAKPETASAGEQRFDDVLEGFIEDALATGQEDVSDDDGEDIPAEQPDRRPAADAALMALCTFPRDQKADEDMTDPPAAPDAARAAVTLLVSAFGQTADDLRPPHAKSEGRVGEGEPAEAIPSAAVVELPSAMEERKLPRIVVEMPIVSPPDPERPDAEASDKPRAEPDIVASLPTLEAESPSQPAPALQIIAHLTQQFAPSPQPVMAASPTRAVRMPDLPEAPGGVTSLRFTLQPEDLGEVEVTLRRAGQETKVTISVVHLTAAETLGRDLSLLEDRLGTLLAAGPAQSVTVTLQSPDPQAGVTGQPGGGQGFGEAALAGGRGSGRDGKSGTEQPEAQRNMTRHDADEDDPATRTAAGRLRVV